MKWNYNIKKNTKYFTWSSIFSRIIIPIKKFLDSMPIFFLLASREQKFFFEGWHPCKMWGWGEYFRCHFPSKKHTLGGLCTLPFKIICPIYFLLSVQFFSNLHYIQSHLPKFFLCEGTDQNLWLGMEFFLGGGVYSFLECSIAKYSLFQDHLMLAPYTFT